MWGFTERSEVLDGIQIYRHPLSEEASGLAGFVREYCSALFGETRLAWKAWRRHRFQIIHLCNPPDLLFLVALPFKLLGVKVVYDVHDLWPEMFEAKFGRRGLLYWLVRAAERLTHACADVVIATNQSVRAVALGRGKKSPADVFVVRTAPKVPPVASVAPDPALRNGRRYLVGYVGVMGSADGVHLLIEAAAHLVGPLGRRDVQFLLLGDGPEHERLLALRDRLGLTEVVTMPGRVYDDPLFRALATIDLGVCCDPINSYNHGCTMNKVLEYMAFGKAQVMFDLREGRESAREAARYVPVDSPIDLAVAIAELLDDEHARETMGRLGAARLHDELAWEKSVIELHRAYDRAAVGLERATG
jgi:glycosyltransferase involved in cell wall biosynthesis